jgi:hypothetical protein
VGAKLCGMPGGRHSLGPGRRVALRDYGYRTRRARVDFAAYAAHLRLPRYFGRGELAVPASWIAVVDLTAPGSPHDPAEFRAQFPGRTIAHLPTASPRRAPTTLLLFAAPQPVPPLTLLAAARPTPRLPFGYRASRRHPPARLDGVLLRADNPRWTVDRFVAAGAMRGVHRDGGWYADQRGTSAARPGVDPAWARPTVDRLDGLARLLALAVIPLVAAMASGTELPRLAWWALVAALVLAAGCKAWAERLYRRPPEPQLRPDKPSHRILTGPGPPGRATAPGGPGGPDAPGRPEGGDPSEWQSRTGGADPTGRVSAHW